MIEEWKPIVGFDDFEISTLGRIRRMSTGMYYKSNNAEIWINKKFCQVGRLILETFIGPPPDKDSKARHLDDNRENNTLSNLAWGTQKENIHDALRNGVFGAKGRVQPPEERRLKSIALTGQTRSEEFKRGQSERALKQVARERELGIRRIRPENLTVKGRIWITNGIDVKLVFPDSIPEGWRLGRK